MPTVKLFAANVGSAKEDILITVNTEAGKSDVQLTGVRLNMSECLLRIQD